MSVFCLKRLWGRHVIPLAGNSAKKKEKRKVVCDPRDLWNGDLVSHHIFKLEFNIVYSVYLSLLHSMCNYKRGLDW
jgi:hypothetical protein